jgi:hypothetical protein
MGGRGELQSVASGSSPFRGVRRYFSSSRGGRPGKSCTSFPLRLPGGAGRKELRQRWTVEVSAIEEWKCPQHRSAHRSGPIQDTLRSLLHLTTLHLPHPRLACYLSNSPPRPCPRFCDLARPGRPGPRSLSLQARRHRAPGPRHLTALVRVIPVSGRKRRCSAALLTITSPSIGRQTCKVKISSFSPCTGYCLLEAIFPPPKWPSVPNVE